MDELIGKANLGNKVSFDTKQKLSLNVENIKAVII